MRKVTIYRKKSIVASLFSMKVYIEDYTTQELAINNIPCRKVGEIKNGEQITFQISENRTKVFVIADKISKGYCNEYYQIPEGINDIFLTGANKFNIATGNAFRFDNNNDLEVINFRRKGRNLGLIISIIAIIGGYYLGRGLVSNLFENDHILKNNIINSNKNDNYKENVKNDTEINFEVEEDKKVIKDTKDFSSKGMKITLSNDFSETNLDNFTLAYQSDEVIITALKEEFSLLEGFENYTLSEYGGLVMRNSGINDNLKAEGNFYYFNYTYTDPNYNLTYYYLSAVFKTNDAFWLVQFCTPNNLAYKYKSEFIDWTKTIEFE